MSEPLSPTEPDDEQGDDATPVGVTRHGRLTLDEIAGLMPGLGTLMPIISDRFGWMVHAARGGNWQLAGYQIRKVLHLFRVGKTTRPRWTEVIDAYVADFLDPLADAIGDRDIGRFEAAASAAVDEANRIHVDTGYGYIVYQVPDEGPAHMVTSAGDPSDGEATRDDGDER